MDANFSLHLAQAKAELKVSDGTKPTYFFLLILACLLFAVLISPPPVNRT